MKELLDELVYLPLAISQAVAYINTNQVSIKQYLHELRSTEEDLVHFMSKGIQDETSLKKTDTAVAKTWIVSFQQISEKDPEAAKLLHFISCIEWKAIPHSILPTSQQVSLMTTAIGTLCSYSFLTRRQDGTTYDMHRLVHLAVRIWNHKCGRVVEIRGKAMKRLATLVPCDFDIIPQIWRTYVPHLARICINSSEATLFEKAYICFHIGQAFLSNAEPEEAMNWQQASHRETAKHFYNHPLHLQSTCQIARIHVMRGRPQVAFQLLEDIVKLSKTLGGGLEVAVRLQQHFALSSSPEAEKHEAEIEILKKSILECAAKLPGFCFRGRSAAEILALSDLQNQSGQTAIKRHKDLMSKMQTTEKHDLDRLAIQASLGKAYLDNNQIEPAIELLEYTKTIVGERVPPAHPQRFAVESNLARAFGLIGKSREAVALLEPLITAAEGVYPKYDLSLVSGQVLLAVEYYKIRRFGKAVALHDRILRVMESRDTGEYPKPAGWEEEFASNKMLLSKARAMANIS